MSPGVAETISEESLMPEGTYREGAIEVTKASAHLPGLDIDIIHRQSPNGDWEQVSINLRATPSFEGVGHFFEATDPFTLWLQTVRLMWMPLLLAAQTMMPPDSRPRTLPSIERSRQEAPTPGESKGQATEAAYSSDFGSGI